MNRRARLGLAATCGDVDDGLDLPPRSNIGMQWNPLVPELVVADYLRSKAALRFLLM